MEGPICQSSDRCAFEHIKSLRHHASTEDDGVGDGLEDRRCITGCSVVQEIARDTNRTPRPFDLGGDADPPTQIAYVGSETGRGPTVQITQHLACETVVADRLRRGAFGLIE